MAPFDEIEPGGPPAEACSKLRVPSGLRSGRAPGRERSSSRGGKSIRASPCLGADEPRGRSLTRQFQYEELHIDKPCSTQIEVSFIFDDAFLPEELRSEDTSIAAAVDDLDVGESCEDCASDFIVDLLTEAVDTFSAEALHSSTSHSNCDADEVDSNYDANSECRDYPDSELSEEEDARPRAHARQLEFSPIGHSMFSQYVSQMFEAALSGNVLDYFNAAGRGITPEEPGHGCDHGAAAELPACSSLLPCSRPSLRRRLRPREIPQSEEFSMDCLPSKPVCAQAAGDRPVEYWAEQLERAAFAEDVVNETLALSLRLEVDAKDKLDEPVLCNETVGIPVAPSAPKPQCNRPKAFQRSYQPAQQQVSLPSTPRLPGTPRHRRAFAEIVYQSPVGQESLPLQPDTGSTPILNDESDSPRPPISSHVVTRPQAPPPQARMSSLNRQMSPRTSSLDFTKKLSKPQLQGGKIRFLSPRSTAEVVPTSVAMDSKDAARSAIALDLGEVAGKGSLSGLHSRRELCNERVAKTNAYDPVAKSYGFLPPIAPTRWGAIEADVGTHAVAWDIV